MKYVYKLCGKVSLVFYIFTLYQLWHLCQYGGLKSHASMLALGIIGCGGTFMLWLISRRYRQKEDSEDKVKNKNFYIEVFIFIIVTLFFGARIDYSSIPYHGALSWKIDEWKRKKEMKLEHNNLFQNGVEGILMDLDEALELPEELYIVNQCKITFDARGTIKSIDAFIYGKDEDGEKKTYLIDYNVDSSSNMTVWLDGNVNGGYDKDKRLSPMIEILKNADWMNQVKEWSETFQEQQIYELVYSGRRSFNSDEGLQYVPGDTDGDGVQTGTSNFAQLRTGGKIVGYEVSLSIPDINSVRSILYITEPEYISEKELDQEHAKQQVNEAKDTESWTVDQREGTMYFFFK